MIRIMEQRKSEELQFDEEENVAERNDKNNISSSLLSFFSPLFHQNNFSDSSGKKFDKIK